MQSNWCRMGWTTTALHGWIAHSVESLTLQRIKLDQSIFAAELEETAEYRCYSAELSRVSVRLNADSRTSSM